MGMKEQIQVLWGLALIDAMDDMVRKIRPYELVRGQTDKVHDATFHQILDGLEHSHKPALKAFEKAVDAFNHIAIDRSVPKPRALVIGEILLNYHPTSNGNIIRYLEDNGLETILPSMVDFFRRDLIRVSDGAARNQIPHPWFQALLAGVSDHVYRHITRKVDELFSRFRFYEPHKDVYELSRNIESFIDRTYMVGEGWLIPAEIIEYAHKGVNSFVIVQPFGCLPNHITGRGLVKAIKKRVPWIQVVSLDYDPDTSFANIENRLQMLVMQAKEMEKRGTPTSSPRPGLATHEISRDYAPIV
jgi:predicted nucleotide-binding protein (sugar kinase/HSP70/actin superfamily)